MKRWIQILYIFCALVAAQHAFAQLSDPPKLLPARPPQCPSEASTCEGYDAIVFVHGIYGDGTTFRNDNDFDWPRQFPTTLVERPIDVFSLNYKSALLTWASSKSPEFGDLAVGIMDTLQPLRQRRYRSIGFIAHSLGGNIVSTYIHLVKTRYGHPQRSQHAFVITLATPVLGSQIANIGHLLKSVLLMNDDLLNSLKRDNLYLHMLNRFRDQEVYKEYRDLCRPVHLHAAYEKDYLGPILVVSADSAAMSIAGLANSPVIGFDLDHKKIAKPTGPQHEVYKWAMGI